MHQTFKKIGDVGFQLALIASIFFIFTSGAFLISWEMHSFLSDHVPLHQTLLAAVIAAGTFLIWLRSRINPLTFQDLAGIQFTKALLQLPARYSVGGLFLAYWVFYSVYLSFMHQGFGTALWDTGFNDQIIWNTAHGHFLITSVRGGYSVLGEHFFLMLALFSPLYWFANSTELIFVFQCLLMASCIPLVYGIAKERGLSHGLSLFFAFLVFLYAPMRNGILFPFHAEMLADPFLLLGVYLALKNRGWVALLSFAFVLMCKENMVLEVLGVGLFLVYQKKKIGIFASVLALTFLIINTQWIEPHFRFDYQWNKWNYFSQWTEPSFAGWFASLQKIFSLELFKFMLLVFGPFLFLPFWARGWYLLLGPSLAVRILTPFTGFRIITAHYTAGLDALIFIGAIFGTQQAISFFKKYPAERYLKIGLLLSGLIFSGISPFFHLEKWLWEASFSENQKIVRVLESIPSHQSVVATETFLAQLTHRSHLFSYSALRPGSPLYKNFEAADFLIVDEGRIQKNEQISLQDFLNRGYSVVFRYAFLTVYANPGMDVSVVKRYVGRWNALSEQEYAYRKIFRFWYKRAVLVGLIALSLVLIVRAFRNLSAAKV